MFHRKRKARNGLTEFRGTISAEIPLDWVGKETVTLLSPNGVANVICSSEALEPPVDTEQYATYHGSLLTEFPGFLEYSYVQAPILGGRAGYVRTFTWEPPDEERAIQIQQYWVSAGRGYTATATALAVDFEQTMPTLEAILDSLTIDAPRR